MVGGMRTRWTRCTMTLPPNLFQVFTLKHPSALDGHTHSTALTHTVPKHTGPSGHSTGWYTTCVHTTHHPIDHCRLLWACTQPISTITHLPFDCHRLCTSQSYFGPLPAQVHPSQQLPSIDIPPHCVTPSSPGGGQGPLGLADVRPATRLPPQSPGPPGIPQSVMGVI